MLVCFSKCRHISSFLVVVSVQPSSVSGHDRGVGAFFFCARDEATGLCFCDVCVRACFVERDDDEDDAFPPSEFPSRVRTGSDNAGLLMRRRFVGRVDLGSDVEGL